MIPHKYVQWLAIALIVFSKIIETKPCQEGKQILEANKTHFFWCAAELKLGIFFSNLKIILNTVK